MIDRQKERYTGAQTKFNEGLIAKLVFGLYLPPLDEELCTNL